MKDYYGEEFVSPGDWENLVHALFICLIVQLSNTKNTKDKNMNIKYDKYPNGLSAAAR